MSFALEINAVGTKEQYCPVMRAVDVPVVLPSPTLLPGVPTTNPRCVSVTLLSCPLEQHRHALVVFRYYCLETQSFVP